MKISAILMASGVSKRFGEDKAFLPFKDTTFIENILYLLTKSKVDEVKAVVNSKIYNYLSEKTRDKKIKLIKNTQNLHGQSKSIQMGVSSCHNTDGFMFLSLDQPLLSVKTIDLVIKNFEEEKIIVPNYGGKNGLPTIFAKIYKNELENIVGDIGGREIIKRHIQMVKRVKIEDEKEGFDVDTKEDFERLKKII